METSRTGREAATGWCGSMGCELVREGVRLARIRSDPFGATGSRGKEGEEENPDGWVPLAEREKRED